MTNQYLLILNNNNINYKNYLFFASITNSISLFIIICNLLGTIVFNYTLSSQFIFTFSISFPIIIYSLFIGFLTHSQYFMGNLLPNNVPINISFLLVPIELMSLLSRIISLAVRLSANIISGHTLTHMISNFISFLTIKFNHSYYLYDLSIIVYIIVISLLFILSIVEFGIAILQWYVLSLLTVSYISDSLVVH